MADTISALVEKVYAELMVDGSDDRIFSRRLIVQMLNRGIGYLASQGVYGTFWQSPSVTLTAGDVLFTYTPPAHTDSANLTTTLRSIGGVRRTSDGAFVQIVRSDAVEALLAANDASRATGPPQFVAFYVTGEKTSVESVANAVKVLIWPEPAAADLPEKLEFMFSTTQSMRFTETRPNDSVAFADGAERALTLRTAALLVVRAGESQLNRMLGMDKAWVSVAIDESEALIKDEARRLYALQLPEDIILMEA